MAYNRKDYYYKKAKAEGKASRAAYKLTQLDAKFHLIKRGDSVIDLGCAPGGWIQEISHIVGASGKIVGVDLLPIKIHLSANARFILGNIEDDTILLKVVDILGKKADVIVSDMAPNTSGVAFADAYRSFELATKALEGCHSLLKEGGNFLVKIFMGEEVEAFRKTLQQSFKKVNTVTPPATRKESKEIYFVCTGYSYMRERENPAEAGG